MAGRRSLLAHDTFICMKPAKVTPVPAAPTPDATYDPVLVSIDSGTSTTTVVAVEWRDGAGELHHADLDVEYVDARSDAEKRADSANS